jgi:hypothetical protein
MPEEKDDIGIAKNPSNERPLKFYRWYPAVNLLPISDAEKHVLCMAITFREKGIRMGNEAIGQVIHRAAKTIGNIVNKLERKHLLRVHNKQSRYRVIFPGCFKSYFHAYEGKVKAHFHDMGVEVKSYFHDIAMEVEGSYFHDLDNLLPRFEQSTSTQLEGATLPPRAWNINNKIKEKEKEGAQSEPSPSPQEATAHPSLEKDTEQPEYITDEEKRKLWADMKRRMNLYDSKHPNSAYANQESKYGETLCG